MKATRQRTKSTPPQLAAEWGIDTHKIIGWIRSGELRAINVATTRTGRPEVLDRPSRHCPVRGGPDCTVADSTHTPATRRPQHH